jgi:hypothetical protein
MSTTVSGSVTPRPTAQTRTWRAKRWLGGNGLAVDLVFAVVFFLSQFLLPNCVATRGGDPGWQQALGEFLRTRAQAGVDYVFTYGPLGYFMCPTYEPALFWPYYIVAVGLGLAATGVTVLVGRRLRPLDVRLVFYVLCLLFVGPSREFTVTLTIAEVALLMLTSPPRLPAVLAATAFLAVCSLVKFTMTLSAAAAVAFLCARLLLQTRRARALLPAVAYGGAVLVLWCLLGQSPNNLPAFVRNSMEIATGYVGAMGLAEVNPCRNVSLAVLAVNCAACAVVAVRGLSRPGAGPAGVYLLAFTALQWKHGFVRDDSHVLMFFAFAMVAPFLLVAAAPEFLGSARACLALGASIALSVNCYCVSYEQWHHDTSLLDQARERYACMRSNAETLLHPRRLRAGLDQVRAQAALEWRLPTIAARVGGASVDVLSVDQHVVLLNGFHWTPRPVFQSYSAYTDRLDKLNAEFYQGEHGPQFVLLNLWAIDGHLPGHEDGGALLALLRYYQPVLRERGYLLLERRHDDAGPQPDVAEAPVIRTARLGEEVVLHTAPGRYTTLGVHMRLTAAGKLLQAAYRPPVVTLHARTDDGQSMEYRLVPDMAHGPFLLDPLVEFTDDFLGLYGPRRGRRVASFWLSVARAPLGIEAYAPEFEVTLGSHALPRVTDQAWEKVAYHMFETIPQSAEAPWMSECRYEGRDCLVVHNPGCVTFDLPSGANQLEAGFGILPSAYEGECHSDGVEFVVERVQPGGRRDVLWRRRLDPLHTAGDRGIHFLHLSLPEGAPDSLLQLRTTDTPGHDDRWDWGFWTGVKIR